MALDPCADCSHPCSPRAVACPSCGRRLAGHPGEGRWALELAAILALFGAGSIAYALWFHETLIVTEERAKFWFGFQLVTLALACAALGLWRQTRTSSRPDAAS